MPRSRTFTPGEVGLCFCPSFELVEDKVDKMDTELALVVSDNSTSCAEQDVPCSCKVDSRTDVISAEGERSVLAVASTSIEDALKRR